MMPSTATPPITEPAIRLAFGLLPPPPESAPPADCVGVDMPEEVEVADADTADAVVDAITGVDKATGVMSASN